MGTWGVGLFANDLSMDLKEAFKELVRLPLSVPELVEAMLEAFPSGRDADDEEYTDFWLSLADLFHAYGIESRAVFERAGAIVESGADVETKRALDMSDADLRKRADLLKALPGKWSRPVAKPRPRRTVKGPEPFLFGEGDCVVYPTQGGNGAPAFMPLAAISRAFAPDGWGAFVVLAAARRHGYWACYLIGRLHIRSQNKPTLEDCRSAVFSGNRVGVPGLPHDAAVKTVKISKPEAQKMGLEAIGRFELDRDALGAEFADRYALAADPYWSISGLLRPYGDGPSLIFERPVAMKKLRLGRFLR